MKAISSVVQVTQIRPASRRGSRGGIPSCGIWTTRNDDAASLQMSQCDDSDASEERQSFVLENSVSRGTVEVFHKLSTSAGEHSYHTQTSTKLSVLVLVGSGFHQDLVTLLHSCLPSTGLTIRSSEHKCRVSRRGRLVV